jgi:hypothetical protein
VMFSEIITAPRVPISGLLRCVGWCTRTTFRVARNFPTFRVKESKKGHRCICLDCLAPKIEALGSSETSVTVYPSTRLNIPEDLDFHQDRCENLRPRIDTVHSESRWDVLRIAVWETWRDFFKRLMSKINFNVWFRTRSDQVSEQHMLSYKLHVSWYRSSVRSTNRREGD